MAGAQGRGQVEAASPFLKKGEAQGRELRVEAISHLPEMSKARGRERVEAISHSSETGKAQDSLETGEAQGRERVEGTSPFSEIGEAQGREQQAEAILHFSEKGEAQCRERVEAISHLLETGKVQDRERVQAISHFSEKGEAERMAEGRMTEAVVGVEDLTERCLEVSEGVMERLGEGVVPTGAHGYTALMDVQFKRGDVNAALATLADMCASTSEEPTCVTHVCLVAAASRSATSAEAVRILQACAETGYSLPLSLLVEELDEDGVEWDRVKEHIDWLAGEEGSLFAEGLCNSLLDLLWNFRQRDKATRVLALAVGRGIFRSFVARVGEPDWRADVRYLSPGGSLAAVAVWLNRMQAAALEGRPAFPNRVALTTGVGNMKSRVSVRRTVKSFLWAMGAPFFPSPQQKGVLVAKGHSLSMWLKNNSAALHLESSLTDVVPLPTLSSVALFQRALVDAQLAAALKEINDISTPGMAGTLLSSPSKYRRLIEMRGDARYEYIQQYKDFKALNDGIVSSLAVF